MSAVPKQFSVSNLLEVNDWLAASVDKATLPEAVYKANILSVLL